MNSWPPPPKGQPPMRLDNKPVSRPESSLLLAAAGTALPFGFIFFANRLPSDLVRFGGVIILVANPVLLIVGVIEGIRERRRLLGLVGLIWSLLALILFLAAVLFPVFAKARERA